MNNKYNKYRRFKRIFAHLDYRTPEYNVNVLQSFSLSCVVLKCGNHGFYTLNHNFNAMFTGPNIAAMVDILYQINIQD